MAEETYSVKENYEQRELRFDVVCGNRKVVKSIYKGSEADFWAKKLNEETAPLIAALEEKALEIMRLQEALADATLYGDVNSGEIDFTKLHGEELEAYFEARKRHMARKGQTE